MPDAIPTITPRELHDRDGAGPLVDVRTPAEFTEVHATGARLVPLGDLDAATARELAAEAGEEIFLICKSGSRSAKAAERFADTDTRAVVVEGGTEAWVAAGLPVVRGKAGLSLERQVRIAAGSLVLLGVIGGWLVHPGLLAVAGFVGAGLVFAGLTDTCGMAMLLSRMPWNRSGATTCTPASASS